jgi:WD40 repeat protein
MRRLTDSLLLAILIWSVGLSLCSTVFAESGNPTIVINPDAYAWSPDGSRLLYGDMHGLWIVAAPDFHAPVQLVRWEPFLEIEDISWTPDGKRVAFVSQRLGDYWDTVWVANADGSRLRDGVPLGSPLTVPGSRALGIETWLDNQRAAVGMHCGTGFVCHFIVNIESGEALDLCGSEGSFFWSANKQMAVVQNIPGLSGTPHGLGLEAAWNATPIQPDHRVPKRCWSSFGGCLEHGNCEEPWFVPTFNSWQPPYHDSQLLSVLYTEQLDHRSDLKQWNIWDGSRTRIATNARDGLWSPDGKEIAFILQGEPIYDSGKRLTGGSGAKGRSHLAIVDYDSRHLIALTRPLRSAAWSADSTSLAGIGSDGAFYVWSSASPKVQLHKLRNGVTSFSWAPDGRWIAAITGAKDQAVFPPTADEAVYFPPVGSDEFNLSKAAVIKGYFEKMHTRTNSENEWKFRLAYAQSLEKVEEPKDAAAQYEKIFAIMDRNDQLRSSIEMEIDSYYESFAAHYPKYALPNVRFGKGYTPGSGLDRGENGSPTEIQGQLLTIIDLRQTH